MQKIIDYIKTFLLYGDSNAAKLIGYTSDETEWSKYPIVIIPNGHLGKDWVMPDLGEVQYLAPNIIRTDILYNTLFFISRAEELINPQRDEHGRFLAQYSLLGKDNRLQTPLVDGYSRLLLQLLKLPLPQNSIHSICLTHDIDTIAYYRHLRGFIGGWLRAGMDAVLDAAEDINNDPAYTFPWLVEQDKQVAGAKVIYFIKHTLGRGFDYPQYNLLGRDFLRLGKMLLNSGATLALHSSYYGKLPYIPSKPTPVDYRIHRSHFLRCSINQMQKLADAGVTDDYTMGFADCAGFRLQTARPVRWINPKTMQLTSLTLHPLTIMDCTLSNANYMHLNEDEAYMVCQRLIEQVKQHHGELNLLWHNNTPTNNPYHFSLYSRILATL